ncbi:MAG: cytochrome c [Betaproteobacteria bacterium]
MSKRAGKATLMAGLLALTLLLIVAALLWRDLYPQRPAGSTAATAAPASQALIERGAYLARAGNCMGCHTERGGAAYAGGRGIATPFGTVYAGNLTPDAATGIGAWSAEDFWQALRHGRARDGRLLYPAFPYANYSRLQREDADAIYAFLRSLAPAVRPNTAHELRWPFSTQWALAAWRALYFKPAAFEPQASQSPAYNRGAYLVQGLGHCSACHSARNALGASQPLDLAGGLIPMQNWYAPSLTDARQAGLMDWPLADIVSLMQTGVSPRGSVQGPMAEVVLHSTQHLSETDLLAMATYLKALPTSPRPAPPAQLAQPNAAGAALYDKHCVQCHGAQGQGVSAAYPALAGNRAVSMDSTVNLVQMVLHGGYPPATAGNPRPYGMPPYWMDLSEQDIANLLNHLRSSWGHQAGSVSAVDVQAARSRQ